MAIKDDIRSQALELSELERGEFARDLLLSLEAPEGAQGAVDHAWASELTRRLDDVLAGRAETVSSEDAHKQLTALIRRIRRK